MRQDKGALQTREEMGPQSKWGRHCCRPHSHQRVVYLPVRIRRCFHSGSTWRPMSFPPTSRRVFHRRSHRHPVPSSHGACCSGPKPFPAAPAFRRYRDRSPVVAFDLKRTDFPPKLPTPSSIDDRVPDLNSGSARSLLKQTLLCRAETLRMRLLEQRVDSHHCIESLKNSPEIQSVRTRFRWRFAPFR